MASGDRLQVILEARDEMTAEIRKAQKSIKALEAEQKGYADQAEKGNREAAQSYERVRREILDQKQDLGRLRAEQKLASSEARKLADAQARAAFNARTALKSQADAMQGVARVTTLTTSAIKVQARQWDMLKMKVSYAAAHFKSRWTAAIAAVKARMATLHGALAASGVARGAGMLAAGAGLAGLGLTVVGVKTASQLEQSQIALEQMMGSAEKAAGMLEWLKQTAARTPFELAGLTMAAQKLMAFGFSAEDARKNLLVIGDAASATGLGQDGIDRVTMALGQMQAKQKISGEEMLQLTEAGIPAWQLLADKMGMSVAELQAMTAQAGGGAKVFGAGGLPKLIDAMGEKYDGLMGKQSQTLSGLWSTLKDTVGLAAADLINKYLPQIKAALKGMINGAGSAFEVVKRIIHVVEPPLSFLVRTVRDNKEAFIAGAAAIGVMTLAMGALAIATNATGIPALIFAIGAFVGLIVMAYKRVDWFRAAVDGAFRWIKQAVAWFVDWFKAYAWPVIQAIFKVWVAYLRNVVWPIIRFVFRAIAAVIKVVWKFITEVFWPGVRRVFGAFINVGRTVWQGVKTAWDKVVSIFRGAKERIGTVVGSVKDFFTNLWSGLTDGLPAAIETMKEWLSKIPGLGAVIDAMLFTGGPVAAGTTALVGELGPEVFVPRFGAPQVIGSGGPEVRDFSQSGFVVPNHLLHAGGTTTTVTRERVVEQARGPLVENLVVRSEADAMRELQRMQAREARINSERRG